VTQDAKAPKIHRSRCRPWAEVLGTGFVREDLTGHVLAFGFDYASLASRTVSGVVPAAKAELANGAAIRFRSCPTATASNRNHLARTEQASL
jgi:hypothetical protein